MQCRKCEAQIVQRDGWWWEQGESGESFTGRDCLDGQRHVPSGADINIVVARGEVILSCIECDTLLMRIKAGDSVDLRTLLSDIEQLRHECDEDG
jgi:hypothetical protein